LGRFINYYTSSIPMVITSISVTADKLRSLVIKYLASQDIDAASWIESGVLMPYLALMLAANLAISGRIVINLIVLLFCSVLDVAR
jgi:hypothetical protein